MHNGLRSLLSHSTRLLATEWKCHIFSESQQQKRPFGETFVSHIGDDDRSRLSIEDAKVDRERVGHGSQRYDQTENLGPCVILCPPHKEFDMFS